MSNVPADLSYTKEHEWVKQSDEKRYKVGITDYAQGALGDIVYIQLPKVGDAVTQGRVCGEVESTKSVSEIYAPISGIVIAVNNGLDANPEVMNSDPYVSGWIFEVEIADENQLASLLSAEDYRSLTA
jgi:glycine cleavage system H protein